LNKISRDPRIAALWLVHSRCCADLLRAHGHDQHAANYEAAMQELTEILAEAVGRMSLASAIDWASENLWADRATNTSPRIEN
jgi:hypothetical protein